MADTTFEHEMKAAFRPFLVPSSSPAERRAAIQAMEHVLREHFGTPVRPLLMDEPEDRKMAAAGKD